MADTEHNVFVARFRRPHARSPVLAAALSTALIGAWFAPTPAEAAPPYRAFSATSWWNTPLPAAAPVDPDSAGIIEWLKGDNDADSIKLAGTSSTGEWGQPIFWADADDPTYDVVQTRYTLPAEFNNLRIPREATADPTVDAELTIYDLAAGYVSTLHRAAYDATTDTWSAGGASLYYLGSNGLDGKLAQADDRRNFGHRGVPPSAYAVRYDEIKAGSIDHVLKVAVNTTQNSYVFPMTGHENGTTEPFAPPEGARLRIKPSVDLGALGLTPQARTIATALQRYGAVVGDQSGSNVTLKVENTVAQGLGQLWSGVLTGNSLSAIPLDLFEVVAHGYQPPASTQSTEAATSTTPTTPTTGITAPSPSVAASVTSVPTPTPAISATPTSSPPSVAIAPGLDSAPSVEASPGQIELSLRTLMNADREAAGRPPLRMRRKLVQVARRQSAKMANAGSLSHNPRLPKLLRRLDWLALAENVGVGPDVEGLHEAFMGSPLHRKNILGSFTSVGVGAVVRDGQTWVTAVFIG